MVDIFAINSMSHSLQICLDFIFLSDLALAGCTCLEIYFIFLLAYEIMVSLLYFQICRSHALPNLIPSLLTPIPSLPSWLTYFKIQILHMIENMWHSSFWVWQISLSTMASTSIHFSAHDIVLFFFRKCWIQLSCLLYMLIRHCTSRMIL